MSSGRLQEVKKNENFKTVSQKVVAVAYQRFSFTRRVK